VSPHAPGVGAIIVNFNGGDRVMRVLDALESQSYPLVETVVVDNGSTDSSLQRIRTCVPRVRIIALNDNIGLSAARNIGLNALGTPLALLVDHDIYVDRHCVGLMVQAFTEHHPTVVCPRIRLLPEREIVQAEGASPHFIGTFALRHAFADIRALPKVAGEVGGCTGGCMLLDRAAAMAAGGFDELFFFYMEDLEFSLRLRALGHRFWCNPAAEVFHERAAGTPGLTFRGSEPYPTRRAYMTVRNRLLTMLIHYRLRTILLLLPVLVPYEFASLVGLARRGQAMAWFRAWGWPILHSRIVARRRQQMQQKRRVPDRALLVGGPLPLAPGFVSSRFEVWLVRMLSRALDGYWSIVRRWVG
jgi:GT2 family glycosyltransferase